MNNPQTMPEDTKKVFMKLGTCSRTYFYILNREFGNLKETEEHAADPLAGGIMQRGHQCGMLWGTALAVGAESYRRHNVPEKAIGPAIRATQKVMESFTKRTGSINCRQITGIDFLNKFHMFKFMLKFILHIDRKCFNLAEKWAPEAIQTATISLSGEQGELNKHSLSCSSLVAQKMGASEEEMVMVAGFAGGMGLSGNGCGALGAAIWMKSLGWCREDGNNKKMAISNPDATKTMDAFLEETNSEMLCHKICNKRFKTIEEHTEFVKNGGCSELINVLAQS